MCTNQARRNSVGTRRESQGAVRLWRRQRTGDRAADWVQACEEGQRGWWVSGCGANRRGAGEAKLSQFEYKEVTNTKDRWVET